MSKNEKKAGNSRAAKLPRSLLGGGQQKKELKELKELNRLRYLKDDEFDEFDDHLCHPELN